MTFHVRTVNCRFLGLLCHQVVIIFQGEQGERGEQGMAGVPGTPGLPGEPGLDGSMGLKGEKVRITITARQFASDWFDTDVYFFQY